uniref:Uncharacterized protein n=1 Tax=Cucumis sativus TaxID=3659 RepID=A0A0A0KEK9_CUCSA
MPQVDWRTGSSPFHIRLGHIAGPHPLPSRQFQALFDSLFKVLFIFPSRYLFAIGLSPIFSLGQNLPPDWGCIPKQPDSLTAPRGATGSERNGALTLSGAPFQGTCARSAAEDASPDYNSNVDDARFSSWALPGSLAVTRGILSRLTWGRVESVVPLRGRRSEGHAGVRGVHVKVETRHRGWINHRSVATTSVEDSNLSHPHDGAHGRPVCALARTTSPHGGRGSCVGGDNDA